jgi:hypothetical protein
MLINPLTEGESSANRRPEVFVHSFDLLKRYIGPPIPGRFRRAGEAGGADGDTEAQEQAYDRSYGEGPHDGGEAARDFHAVLARVRDDAEVVVEQDHTCALR